MCKAWILYSIPFDRELLEAHTLIAHVHIIFWHYRFARSQLALSFSKSKIASQ